MKKYFLLLSIAIVCFSTASAQYFNPYAAYQYGQQLAEQQMRANQNAYDMGRAMGMVQMGYKNIAEGDYEEAVSQFEEAIDLNYAPAYECLGLCYELGIGVDRDVDYADIYYEKGADLGNSACRVNIQRINRSGHYSASYRSKFLANFKANYARQYGGGGGSMPSYSGGYSGGSSSGSSSAYTTCRICGGSGTCTSCHGSGGSWQDTGYYTGSGNKSWISCGSCNGSKKCFNCYGTGRQ